MAQCSLDRIPSLRHSDSQRFAAGDEPFPTEKTWQLPSVAISCHPVDILNIYRPIDDVCVTLVDRQLAWENDPRQSFMVRSVSQDMIQSEFLTSFGTCPCVS